MSDNIAIQDQATIARARIVQLEQDLSAATQAFADATRAFEATPTTKTATAKMVAEQVELNAQKALDAAREEAAGVLTAEAEASRAALIERLNQHGFHLESRIDDALAEMVQADRAFAESVQRVRKLLAERNRVFYELDQRTGVPHAKLNPDGVIDRMRGAYGGFDPDWRTTQHWRHIWAPDDGLEWGRECRSTNIHMEDK